VEKFAGRSTEINFLKEYYDMFEINTNGSVLEFNGGFVGSFGYDFIRYTENLPDCNPDEIGIETIQLMVTTQFIAIDHMAETLTAVVLERDSKEGEEEALIQIDKLINKALKQCDIDDLKNIETMQKIPYKAFEGIIKVLFKASFKTILKA